MEFAACIVDGVCLGNDFCEGLSSNITRVLEGTHRTAPRQCLPKCVTRERATTPLFLSVCLTVTCMQVRRCVRVPFFTLGLCVMPRRVGAFDVPL